MATIERCLGQESQSNKVAGALYPVLDPYFRGTIEGQRGNRSAREIW